MALAETSRAELLQLTPDRYLSEGWTDAVGQPRRILLGEAATAVATQLLAAHVAPQEFGFTVAALRETLKLAEGDPALRLATALDEAIEVTSRMIGQPNNEGLIEWLISCAGLVRTRLDLVAFTAHLDAVLRLYTVLATLPPPPSEPS